MNNQIDFVEDIQKIRLALTHECFHLAAAELLHVPVPVIAVPEQASKFAYVMLHDSATLLTRTCVCLAPSLGPLPPSFGDLLLSDYRLRDQAYDWLRAHADTLVQRVDSLYSRVQVLEAGNGYIIDPLGEALYYQPYDLAQQSFHIVAWELRSGLREL